MMSSKLKFYKQPFLLALSTSLILLQPIHGQANVQTFWNDYPSCEEACHESVFTSQQCSLENSCACSGCLCLDDNCLCETSSWLIAVAQCIGQSCGASDVTTAASIVQSACNGNGLALAVGSAALVSYGMAAIPNPTEAATTDATAAAAGTTKTTQKPITVANTPTTQAPEASSSITPPSSSTIPPDTSVSSTQGISSLIPSTTLSTSTTQSSTSTSSSSSPTSTPKYSTSDKIALGCGIGIGLPAALAAILTVVMGCGSRSLK